MGNSAKVSYICLGIKKHGVDCGSTALFISFSGDEPEYYCHVKRVYRHFAKALAVNEAHELIMELCQISAVKKIYFCGMQPLARYDWLTRLSETNLPLTFNIITNTPDIKSLAKLLPAVQNIEWQIDLTKELDDVCLKKFIILANLRNVSIIIKTKPLQKLSKTKNFIKIIADINNEISVFIKTESFEEFLNYHSLAAKYLKNVFALNNVIFEVENENTYK